MVNKIPSSSLTSGETFQILEYPDTLNSQFPRCEQTQKQSQTVTPKSTVSVQTDLNHYEECLNKSEGTYNTLECISLKIRCIGVA